MVVVAAGGCGCKFANRYPGDDVICVGSSLDLSYLERDDVPRIRVEAGSPTGAHRDHTRAFKQLKEVDENREKIDKVLSLARDMVRKRKRVPVVAFGLGGAVGLAMARLIADHVPCIWAMVLPAPNEPEAALGEEKFEFLMRARSSERCLVVARSSRYPEDKETFDGLAADLVSLPRDLDLVQNWAKMDAHRLDGKVMSLDKIRNTISMYAERARAEGVVVEDEEVKQMIEKLAEEEGEEETEDWIKRIGV
ncbi:MAG: hypothetical protein GXO28_00420 [Methanopyri archaeon]|nr:hypothetical protein [Methanopyri archaeon]